MMRAYAVGMVMIAFPASFLLTLCILHISS